MKFSKRQLDSIATLLGAIMTTCGILLTYEVGDRKIVGMVGAFALGIHGWVTQKPADAHPTTEEVEDLETSG